jgi:4-hydroxy-tetrahydrodipicolinate reductase
MKIAQIGTGNMGKIVASLAHDAGHSITTLVTSGDSELIAQELAERIGGADVVIDFSIAGAVRRNVEACLIAGVPLVEGSTGWQDELPDIERSVRERMGAIVYGANFSIGVNLFYRIVGHAAELFARFDQYETFIEEQHHSRKKDAPSGTALKLKDIVSTYIRREFTVSSTRAGNIPGTHRVGFDGPADQVLLEHTARSRDGFALGALAAAEWIIGKTGFFEFTEVVDEIVAK